MPIKKKVTKKSTTSKTKKEKKPEDEEEKKPTYPIPEYKDPKIYTPRAQLNIALMSPIAVKLNFTVEVMITTRVE